MLRSMEVRTALIALLTSLGGWGLLQVVDGAQDRAATQARLEQHDRELARQRDAIERIALVLERQTALSETYGAALRDIATELHERKEPKR